jgi:hypothetical protein
VESGVQSHISSDSLNGEVDTNTPKSLIGTTLIGKPLYWPKKEDLRVLLRFFKSQLYYLFDPSISSSSGIPRFHFSYLNVKSILYKPRGNISVGMTCENRLVRHNVTFCGC